MIRWVEDCLLLGAQRVGISGTESSWWLITSDTSLAVPGLLKFNVLINDWGDGTESAPSKHRLGKLTRAEVCL